MNWLWTASYDPCWYPIMKWWPKILLAVCVITLGSAGLVWYVFHNEAVAPGLEQGVRQIVKRNPTLQPLLERAAADGVLTTSEANAIIDAAEKLEAAVR